MFARVLPPAGCGHAQPGAGDDGAFDHRDRDAVRLRTCGRRRQAAAAAGGETPRVRRRAACARCDRNRAADAEPPRIGAPHALPLQARHASSTRNMPASTVSDPARCNAFVCSTSRFHMMAGPYCARLLADVGAEVLKIEPPEGDDMRQRAPLRNGHGSYFGQLNAGKRSLALDLKHPEALALVQQLVAEADVLVENFRPGVMDRLGLGADTLRRINPRLVYCSISGYGQDGPAAERAAYAMIVHAASGFDRTLMRYAGDRDRPAPRRRLRRRRAGWHLRLLGDPDRAAAARAHGRRPAGRRGADGLHAEPAGLRTAGSAAAAAAARTYGPVRASRRRPDRGTDHAAQLPFPVRRHRPPRTQNRRALRHHRHAQPQLARPDEYRRGVVKGAHRRRMPRGV